MNKVYVTIPDFVSEKEEAEWLDAHAEELDGSFAEAAANGTLMNRNQFREILLRDPDLVLPEAIISIPLTKQDLARTKAIAASEGLDA